MEGSSDSVVLERLCAAFEKKGAGAEGKGEGGKRVPSPAGSQSLRLCPMQNAPGRGLPGRGLGAEPSPCVRALVSRARASRSPAHVWSNYRVLGPCCTAVSPRVACGSR